jgi:hypothetical protein
VTSDFPDVTTAYAPAAMGAGFFGFEISVVDDDASHHTLPSLLDASRRCVIAARHRERRSFFRENIAGKKVRPKMLS